MIHNVLLDTGPLVALIDRHDRHHAWVEAQFQNILPPLLTSEAVITEASELVADCRVFTLDSDFRIYRRHKRQKIPLLLPPKL